MAGNNENNVNELENDNQKQNANEAQEENAVVAPPQAPIQQEPPKQNPAPAQDLGPEWISMSEFDQKLERLKKIKASPTTTKQGISAILRESGGEIGDADDPLEFAKIIEDAYAPEKLPRDALQSMRDVTKSVFISTYDALSKKGFTPKNKIETAQRITDVLLKYYSPLTLTTIKELEKYKTNYVTGDKQLLRECLTSLKVPENEIKAIVGDVKPEVKPSPAQGKDNKPKDEAKEKKKTVYDGKKDVANVAVFSNKLTAFSSMYKIDVNANDFVFALSEAWTLMKNGDEQKRANGQKMMGDLFKNILKTSFEVERNASYNEHRIPEFNEIIKSTNELFRSAMYAFTDLYHDPQSASLFDATSYAGLNAKEMAALTAGDSPWKMDQKSDEAWEAQSREAKDLAALWLKENNPYEKMINEMNGLIDSMKKGSLGMREIYAKLTAAEWLLVNNEKMMVEDPEDPLNPIPNWGNRYWKALTAAREEAGISKHTSMRDLIQSDYAAIAKAVVNTNYNEKQIDDFVLAPEAREMDDSLEAQKEEFTTQSRDVILKEPKSEKTDEKADEHKNEIRWQISVKSQDQKEIMKSEPRVFSNMVIEKNAKVKIEAAKEDFR